MNFMAKCLIFFLNVVLALLVVTPSPTIAADSAPAPSRAIKKASKLGAKGAQSSGALKVLASWQVIGSAGKGATMGTRAESYAASGILFQSAPSQWKLKIDTTEIPVTFQLGEAGVESVLTAERADLLKVFSIELSDEDRKFFAEGSEQTAFLMTEGVRMTLGRAPSRLMDTIYRSPSEGLFLVKGTLTLVR